MKSAINPCQRCGQPQKQLLTSWYCDCPEKSSLDLPESYWFDTSSGSIYTASFKIPKKDICYHLAVINGTCTGCGENVS